MALINNIYYRLYEPDTIHLLQESSQNMSAFTSNIHSFAPHGMAMRKFSIYNEFTMFLYLYIVFKQHSEKSR